jgi:hypothetical protein
MRALTLAALLATASATAQPVVTASTLAERLEIYRVLWPHPIDEALASLTRTIALEVSCPASRLPASAPDLAGGKRTLPAQIVEIRIRTHSIPWNKELNKNSHHDGNYEWNLTQSYDGEGRRLPVEAANELSLRPAALTGDSTAHEIEHVLLFYHEMLHGQLMIDAILTDPQWRNDFCDFSEGGQTPSLLRPSDSRHERIPKIEKSLRELLQQVVLGREKDRQDPWSPLPENTQK